MVKYWIIAAIILVIFFFPRTIERQGGKQAQCLQQPIDALERDADEVSW